MPMIYSTAMTARNTASGLVALFGLLTCLGTTQAAVFQVPESDVPALKQAIATANGNNEDDVIELATRGRYVLSSIDNNAAGENGLPIITPDGGHKLTLHGNGATIERSAAEDTPFFRIFYIARGADVTMYGLTISNGVGPYDGGGGGGAIANFAGTVALKDCAITGNRSVYGGGGIMNNGSEGAARLNVTNCYFQGNSGTEGGAIQNHSVGVSAALGVSHSRFVENHASSGGAVSNYAPFYGGGSAVLYGSEFANNTADHTGGAIHNFTTVGSNADMQIENCTIRDNHAAGGAALADGAGNSEIRNCTITGNKAGSGGAIYNRYTGSVVRIVNSTLSGNSAGNGGTIHNSRSSGESTVVLTNTIVSGVGSASTVAAERLTSEGHNICTDNCGGYLTGPNDRINTDPRLDPGGLKDNGGSTKTIALLPDSPALDRAHVEHATGVDQRGARRVGDPDIGAFEFGATAPQPRFANISTRLRVETGNNVLIAGFIVTGYATKEVLVRAIGPSLNSNTALPNPRLELFDNDGRLVASNDNWQDALNRQEIIDSTIPPSHQLESAVLRFLPDGPYTAVVRDVGGGSGVGLVEVYDLGNVQDSALGNISTRGRVQTGDDVMIGGMIIVGPAAQKLIIRAIGPSLPVDGKLEDPALELFDGSGNRIASNNNWKDTQQAEIERTYIPPKHDLESAIVASLPPGAYTAVVRGVNDSSGVALVEAYTLEYR